MRQVVGRRNNNDTFPDRFREMPQVSGHQPRCCRVRQRDERNIAWVRQLKWPRPWIRELKATFDKKIQPERRKPVRLELRPVDHISIFKKYCRADDNVDLIR